MLARRYNERDAGRGRPRGALRLVAQPALARGRSKRLPRPLQGAPPSSPWEPCTWSGRAAWSSCCAPMATPCGMSSWHPGRRPRNERASGGRLLVDQLVIHGADLAFTVPGESFLAVLDGFYDVQDRLKLVVCRHESGASYMAEAYGKLTNRPGIAFVTRGPGATQAAVGRAHGIPGFHADDPASSATWRSDFRDREAFQEVDFAAMFARSRSGSSASTTWTAFPSTWRAPSRSPRRGAAAPSCWRYPRTCSSRDVEGGRREAATHPPRRIPVPGTWSACASCSRAPRVPS